MKNITSEELFPMTVTPLNFTRGDVVKKIFTDNLTTPYVGVVTSVVPSTNKVEVQWPHGNGLEDPWDLIKVNPIINPPVVKQDKAYKTHQNQKAQQYNEKFFKKLDHYNVLNEFVNENLQPLIMRISKFYNEGYSKKEAFEKVKLKYENNHILKSALDKIYNDSVYLKRTNVLDIEGNAKEASLEIKGNSNEGFKVSYSLGKNNQSNYFSSYKLAFEAFKTYEDIMVNLDNKQDYSDIVSKVAKLSSQSSVRDHIENIKTADVAILVDRILKNLEEK
jgi:hypothetical protein